MPLLIEFLNKVIHICCVENTAQSLDPSAPGMSAALRLYLPKVAVEIAPWLKNVVLKVRFTLRPVFRRIEPDLDRPENENTLSEWSVPIHGQFTLRLIMEDNPIQPRADLST